MNKAVQKALAVLMCIGMCISLTPVSLAEADAGDGKTITLIEAESFDAARGFAVNASNFPDPTFRAFVEEHCDTDGDLVLNDMEIAAVTEMDVHGLGISDLTGIAEFFYLRTLNCSENCLMYLDVSDLANLEELYCQDNFYAEHEIDGNFQVSGLKSLTLNNNLKVLWCQNNRLSNLSFEDAMLNEETQELDFPLHLDLRQCPELLYLNCSNNPLFNLDLSPVPKLQELRCNNAYLSKLDLHNVPELCVLWCWNEVFGNIHGYNNIDSIDLSGCPKLASVVINGIRENYYFHAAFFDGESEVSVSTLKPVSLYLGEERGEFVVNKASTAVEIEIVAVDDETAFPDENFRDRIRQYDQNDNSYLSNLEIAKVNSINVKKCDISSLKGIEFFTALNYLFCGDNHLTSLDLSANTVLMTLSCENNQLTDLNLSTNSALSDLNCAYNRLTALDLSANRNLSQLNCIHNQLTELDLSHNTELNTLYCAENSLGDVYIGDCHLLTQTVRNGERQIANENYVAYSFVDSDLGISSGCVLDKSASLNMENSLNAEEIIPDNAFRIFVGEVVDADHNDRLSAKERRSVTEINCSGREIQSLEGLEYFPELLVLDCSNNRLDLLDLRLCPHLYAVVTSADASTSDGITRYDTDAGTLTVDSTVHLLLQKADSFPLENFRDDAFRAYIREYIDIDGSGGLDPEEIARVTTLDVSSFGIQDLTGIEIFQELTSLNCSWNRLRSLDVSELPKLKVLYCQNNRDDYAHIDQGEESIVDQANWDPNYVMQEAEVFNAPATNGGITSLRIGSSPLRILWCYDNSLSSLDLSACPTIENLDCAFNMLTSLDVSGLPNLSALMCHDNNLTELDVSANPELNYLWCWNNPISVLDVSACTKLAAAVANGSVENFSNHVSLFNDEAEISISHDLELYWGQSEADGIPITEDYFPDSDFRSALRVLADKNYDGVLDFDEIASLDYFDCSGWQISSLEGVNYLTELKYLNCRVNYLAELDVSGLSKLELLDCSYNSINFLDVSGNPLLKTLRVTSNNLASLDLSTNSQLHVLWCWNNPLESLDLSNCPVLANLVVSGMTERYDEWTDEYYDEMGEYHEEYHPAYISFYDKSGTGDLSVDEALVTNGGLSAYTIIPIDENAFPDAAFRNYILDSIDGAGGGKDGLLQPWEIEAAREINCSGLHISDLTGIAYFSNLNSLDCSGNDLAQLDISALASLTDLNCSYNNLTSLDTSHNPGLLMLNCSYNMLIEAVFTNNYALESLDCSHNETLQDLCITDCDTIAEFVRTHTPTTKSGVCEYSGSFMREGREIVSVSFRHDAAVQLWAQSYPVPDCVLPRDLQQIGDEAFRGCEFSCVLLSDGIGEIGARAFADSPNLRYIVIPASVTIIPDDAFENVKWLTIVGVPGRDAESYAARMGFLFKPIS